MPNRNGLLNKLIPTLVSIRKERRNKINELFEKHNIHDLHQNLSTVIYGLFDEIYFKNENLILCDDEVWFRPQKSISTCINEICTSELLITASSYSMYIRTLLNEYAVLPQYKRGELIFRNELDIIKKSISGGQIIYFTYHENSFKVFPYEYLYGFIIDQRNILIGFDIVNKAIRCFTISNMKDIFIITSKKLKPKERIIKQLQEYIDECNYDENNIIYVEE